MDFQARLKPGVLPLSAVERDEYEHLNARRNSGPIHGLEFLRLGELAMRAELTEPVSERPIEQARARVVEAAKEFCDHGDQRPLFAAVVELVRLEAEAQP